MQLEVAKAVTDDIICEVESLLRDGLSVVVEQEMKAVYEHMWYVRTYVRMQECSGEVCSSIPYYSRLAISSANSTLHTALN